MNTEMLTRWLILLSPRLWPLAWTGRSQITKVDVDPLYWIELNWIELKWMQHRIVWAVLHPSQLTRCGISKNSEDTRVLMVPMWNILLLPCGTAVPYCGRPFEALGCLDPFLWLASSVELDWVRSRALGDLEALRGILMETPCRRRKSVERK